MNATMESQERANKNINKNQEGYMRTLGEKGEV